MIMEIFEKIELCEQSIVFQIQYFKNELAATPIQSKENISIENRMKKRLNLEMSILHGILKDLSNKMQRDEIWSQYCDVPFDKFRPV